MSDYVIERLTRPALIKVVKEQQEIFKKAIEYIEKEQKDRYEGIIASYQIIEDDLLNILKENNYCNSGDVTNV